NEVYLSEIWPSSHEVQETIARSVQGEMFSRTYADVFTGDPEWRELPVPEGELFAWDPASTYVRRPPYFDGMSLEPGRVDDLHGPGSEGTWTVHLPDGEETTIYDASQRYLAEGVPLIVLAGKEYGSGSSRDWAAKGPNLLGVKAVIAESYERIHRSNLLMMGVLPLQVMDGESLESLGLTGRETFSITGVENGDAREVTVRADDREFRARVRLDTPREREYLRHGGILQYVLRRLLSS